MGVPCSLLVFISLSKKRYVMEGAGPNTNTGPGLLSHYNNQAINALIKDSNES